MISIFKRYHSKIRWFYATDVPLSKPLDPSYKCQKIPQKFLSFSSIDSQKIESRWLELNSNPKVDHTVNVNEDGLFDCDLVKRDIKPTFWNGPNYEIRRGTWFSNNQPLPYYISIEIEKHYQLYKDILESGKEVPGIKLKSEVSLWNTDHRKLDNKLQTPWPYSEWDDICNVPKILYFKDLDNALLLNQGQMIPKIVADNFSTSNHYLGVFSITRGYKEDAKTIENDKSKTSETFNIQNAFGLQKKIFKGDPSEVADQKYQKFMEDDFANNNLSIANSPEREVDHLILAVHGIGQLLSAKYSGVNFAHDCNYLRQLLKSEFIKNTDRYQNLVHPNEDNDNLKQNSKIQILPVIWRNDVEFGWNNVYDDYEDDGETRRLPKLSELNLEAAGPVRSLVSDVVLDVLLYYEPRYRERILEIVTKKFNDTYDLYKKKHPNFKGKVSLLGHSLGSAIVLDIANRQPDNKTENFDKTKDLKFNIENLFCLGSPNGVFQFIKGCNIRPRGSKSPKGSSIQPKANNVYNLFYASDVIAYRMEPLVYSSLGKFEPKEIDVPTNVEVIKSKIKQVDISKILLERFGWKVDLNLNSVVGKSNEEEDIDLPVKVKNDLLKLNKNGRLDYILPRGMFEIDMINALASHIQYFNDADVANFILGEIWKAPDSTIKIKGSRNRNQSSSTNENN